MTGCDASALLALAERVEKAEGPDREIAFALFEALEATPDQLEMIASARRRVAAGELTEADILGWRSFDDSYSARAMQSLDAVLALAEQVLPDAVLVEVSIELVYRNGELVRQNVGRIDNRKSRPQLQVKVGATPALALLSALLSALETQ